MAELRQIAIDGVRIKKAVEQVEEKSIYTAGDNITISNGVISAGSVASQISYITTAPTADNTSGNLIVVVLSSDPVTKYNGYLYIITEE